jgi:hypothetical protein
MFQAIALKKAGALMCLGLLGLAVPGWVVGEEPIRPDSSLRILRVDLIVLLMPVFPPKYLSWTFEQNELPSREGGNIYRMKPKDDIGIVKISILD